MNSGIKATPSAERAGPALKRLPAPCETRTPSRDRKAAIAEARLLASTYSSNELVAMRVVCTSKPASSSRCFAAALNAAAREMASGQLSLSRLSVTPTVTVRTFRIGGTAKHMSSGTGSGMVVGDEEDAVDGAF